jgi:hypothetical protein
MLDIGNEVLNLIPKQMNKKEKREDVKSKLLTIKVTKSEKDRFKELASKNGEAVAQYILNRTINSKG